MCQRQTIFLTFYYIEPLQYENMEDDLFSFCMHLGIVWQVVLLNSVFHPHNHE